MKTCREIPTAAHSLIRLKSGELAYITKRFDRAKTSKLALEDMCQITETLTSDKYRSSMEKVGKHIAKFSTRPGLDAVTFFETALLSFITGNADMHLKNFSLLTTKENDIILSPAYDLVCTKIAMPEDKDEMGLTVNGRKGKLVRNDFDSLEKNLKIPDKAIKNSYEKFAKKIKDANEMIEISFLPSKLKDEYKIVLAENVKKISI